MADRQALATSLSVAGIASVDRAALTMLVGRVQRERNLSDHEMCEILNRRMARIRTGTSGPSQFTITPSVLMTLRDGGTIGEARLRHIEDRLRQEFNLAPPEFQVRPIERVRVALRRVPLLVLLAAMATGAVIALFWLSDKAAQDRILGISSIVGVSLALLALRKEQ